MGRYHIKEVGGNGILKVYYSPHIFTEKLNNNQTKKLHKQEYVQKICIFRDLFQLAAGIPKLTMDPPTVPAPAHMIKATYWILLF